MAHAFGAKHNIKWREMLKTITCKSKKKNQQADLGEM